MQSNDDLPFFFHRLELELQRDKQERDERERELRERQLRELEFREKMKQEIEMKPPGKMREKKKERVKESG